MYVFLLYYQRIYTLVYIITSNEYVLFAYVSYSYAMLGIFDKCINAR